MNQGKLGDNQTIDEAFLVRQAVEGMQDALYISDLRTGELTYFSPASIAVAGFSPAEMQALKAEGVRARVHPEDRERYLERIRDLAEAARRTGTPQSEQLEYRWLHKDGTYRWISNSRTLLLDEKGQPKALVGTVRDVTEQKETEQTLRENEGLLREVLANSRDALYRRNLRTGTYDYFSPAIEALTGYTAEELIDLTAEGSENLLHPDDRPTYSAHTQALLESADPAPVDTVEYRWKTKGGKYRWFSNSRRVVCDESKQPVALVGTLRDIADQKEAEVEREHLMTDVVREHRVLATIMENTPAALAYLDRDFRFVQVNSAYARDARYSREELLGRNHFDLFPNAENQAIFEHVRDTGEPVRFEARPFVDVYQPEKGVTYWDWSLIPVKGPEGQVEGLVFSLLNVTEHERLLAEVERRAAELDATIEAISDGLVLHGPKGEFRHLNQAGERILGITAENYAAIPPQERPERLRAETLDGRALTPAEFPSDRALRGETLTNYHMVIHRPDGACADLLVSAAPIRDPQGEIIGTVVNFADITPLITLREDAERRVAELDATFGAIRDGLLILGQDDEIVRMNQAAEHLAGITTEQWMRVPPVVGSEVIGAETADGRPLALEETPRYRAEHGEEVVGFHMALRRPDGSRRLVHASAGPIRNAEGHITGVVVSWADVTSEVALRNQVETERARLEIVLETLPVGVWVTDGQGQIIRKNRAADRIWAGEAPLSKNIEDYLQYVARYADSDRLLSPEEYPVAIVLRTGQPVEPVELRIRRFDDSEGTVLVSAAPIKDAQGQLVGVIGVNVDITDRKQAEQQVQTERARLEAVLEALPVGVFLADPSGRLTLTNRAANDIWGQAPLSESWNEYSTDYKAWWPETGQRVQPHEWPLTRAVERGETLGAEEMEIETADGQCKTILNYALPVRDASGVLIGGVEVDVDITERKQAEEALQRYRLLSENARDIILFVNVDGRIIEANLAAEQAYGYSRDELLNKTIYDLRAEPAGPLVGAQMAKADAKGITFEAEHRRSDGSVFPVEVSSRGATLGGQRILLSIIRDITERRQAEQALRESEERFATAFRANPNALVLSRMEDGTILDVNDAFLDLFQRTREEVIGNTSRSLNMFAHPEERDQMIGLLRQRRHLRDYEIHIRLKSGEERIAHLSSEMLQVAEGPSLLTILQDVTERRQAEEALRESEERFRNVLDNSLDGIHRLDLRTGTYDFLSPAMETLTGFNNKELVEMGRDGFRERVHPDDRAAYREYMHGVEMQPDQVPPPVEFRWQRKGGEWRWFSDNEHGVADEQGNVVAMVSVVRDISEQRRAEKALRASEERYRTLFETMTEGFALHEMLYDEQGAPSDYRFLEVNPAFEQQTGLRAADIVGRTVKEVIPGIEHLWVERYDQVVRTGQPVQFESWSGPLGRWYNVSAFRTEPQRFAVIFLDITDRKRAEEALHDLNETLEERVIDRTARLRGLALELTRAEERERRRLAQVLHDHLQQLLAAARISVNMVRNRLEDDRQAETLGQVDTLLEESIAESRSLTAELSPPVLYDAGLPPALDWLARWMGEKYHLHVEVQAEELDGEVPEEIRLVLFQGARELLFNVVKHAEVDQARVELRRLPEDQIELVVSDQGVGVDPTQIGKQQTKGGFGLFNIRERLESLGGQMQIDSTPGQGTRVTLRVPLRPTEVMEEAVAWATAITQEAAAVAEELVTEREKAEQAATGARVVRVLLADDHVIMRQGLARLLEDEPGIELVGQADDGRQVVELAHVTRPDIILMDVSMPVMDGIEATRQIKADLPNVRVIGLSMYEGAEVAERMREAGAVDYVPKGGNPAELVEAVRRAAAQ